ncbi:MAG: peptidylprolyl isomerase, partial [Chlorobia bacterium]|nr:peptidylprolyl isomerase [Fimbriimonadaceae bacterium]
ALGIAIDQHVIIRTEMGNIELELYPHKAPKTVANFLRYVRAGRYKGGLFHRTVTMGNQPDKKIKIEVIQGGPNPKSGKDLAPIKLERTNKTGVKHTDGAISMARASIDSATSDFFICIGDQPELDFGGKRNPDGQGFAAFGRVVKGMDIVMKIQASPFKDQTLTPKIKILGIDIWRIMES